VILNTCSFISSGREEMFQTVEKLISKKKKVCIIGCGVQYFEKLLKKNMSSFKKGGGFNEVEDGGFLSIDDKKSPVATRQPLSVKGHNSQLQEEFCRREKMLENKNISYLSRNDLTLANLQNLTSRSQTFQDFCRYDAPRLLTNYENRYEYLKIAE
jgi:hypothetical protein